MKILEVKLEYWVPGITIGASGAREENSFTDFTLETCATGGLKCWLS